jgi:hypothetical protein
MVVVVVKSLNISMLRSRGTNIVIFHSVFSLPTRIVFQSNNISKQKWWINNP